MESLTAFLNRKRKLRKKNLGKRNGRVIQIAMSIDRNPEPIRRKVLNIPEMEFKVEPYNQIEVPYIDKNGQERLYVEPAFKDLPLQIQCKERRRILPKYLDMEIIYQLYGTNPE